MEATEPSEETIVKILLDEANLAFCETGERNDESGKRSLEGSIWTEEKMEGEFDPEDYQKILKIQLIMAKICDENPDLEEKSANMFQSVNPDNAGKVLQEVRENPNILELGRIAVHCFLLRFPTVQSYVNKGHPLVLAVDEYMLENADAQNWHDFKFIAKEFGWE